MGTGHSSTWGILAISRREAAKRLLVSPLAVLPLTRRWYAGAASPRADPAPAAAPGPPVFQGYVAGFGYHEGPRLVCEMRAGDEIRLGRERDNPYDPNAVLVFYRGLKIGYVPRSVSAHVAAQLDHPEAGSDPRPAGRDPGLRGTITAVDPDAAPWRAVQIRVGGTATGADSATRFA